MSSLLFSRRRCPHIVFGSASVSVSRLRFCRAALRGCCASGRPGILPSRRPRVPRRIYRNAATGDKRPRPRQIVQDGPQRVAPIVGRISSAGAEPGHRHRHHAGGTVSRPPPPLFCVCPACSACSACSASFLRVFCACWALHNILNMEVFKKWKG